MGIQISHVPGFGSRRLMNWFFMGLAYAFLYWGRYNLTMAKVALGDLMTKEAFGWIFGFGTVIYAFSFLINGPLTDKYGGRRMMLIAVIGSAVMNFLMGLTLKGVIAWHEIPTHWLFWIYCGLYAVNMYFQSIGAVAIVKVNANWFHVTERGSFSGWFGAMISMGLFFAFDISSRIISLAKASGANGVDALWWVFYAPSIALLVIYITEFFLLRDRPSEAGYQDFDTGGVSSGDEKPVPVIDLFKIVFSNKVLLTVAFIGICTGVLRNAIMQWVPIYAKESLAHGGLALDGSHFLRSHWGLLLLVAGVIGPMFGGWASDKLFQSRRAPSAGYLYSLIIFATILMIFNLHNPTMLIAISFLISIGVIGSQGLLTATAAMDFGGKAKATATGLIDGFVYIGTGLQSVCLGYITTHNWAWWPIFMFPFALLGFGLCLRIWQARAADKSTTAH